MSDNDSGGAIACLFYFLFFLAMALIGGAASNYLIATFFHANINFALDMLIGALIGEALIPITIIVWILKATGVI